MEIVFSYPMMTCTLSSGVCYTIEKRADGERFFDSMLIALLMLAVISDMKSYRIPNQLIWLGYASGMIYQILNAGNHFYFYIFSAIVFLLIAIFFFQIRVIGAGDGKLLSVSALYLGFSRTMTLTGLSFLFAAIYSLFLLLFHLINVFQKYKMQKRDETFWSFARRNPIKKIHFSPFILLASLAEHVFLKNR